MNTNYLIKDKYRDLLALAAKSGHTVYQNEFNRLSNQKYVRSLSHNHVLIQDVFRDYWPEFKIKHLDNLRPSIVENVESMISCKDLSKGHIFYECPKCDNFKMIGLSCHSRFCASCGHKYRDMRSIEIQKKLLNVTHRHFVFSVPFDLRPFFWKCRELFDCLFKTVNDSLHHALKLSKKDLQDDYRLGFIAFLHTSGRSLNPHPHLHVLLAEALISKSGKKKNYYYFHFEYLRKTMMFMFLSNASACLKNHASKSLYREFNILRNKIKTQYKDGFYVYGPKDETKEHHKLYSIKLVADYIARYASHPPIAESNILSIDKINKTITWQYIDHETDETITVIDSIDTFISKLIRHIPDKGFHQIRYYGFYSNKSNRTNDKPKLVSNSKIYFLKSKLVWRIMIIESFKFDPLLCACGSKMVINYELSYLNNKSKGGYISDA